MLEQYRRYIDGVKSGNIIACKLVKLAVDRHLADLEKQNTPDFPYWFSEKAAESAIMFVKMLRHSKGSAGRQPFNLQDSQAFILALLFGWKRENGLRRFKKVYLETARKSGKSELCAAIGLYCMIMDDEYGAEIYTAATTREQAGFIFRAAKAMSRFLSKDSEALAKDLPLYEHVVIYSKLNAKFEALSADAKTLEGGSPHVAFIDEYKDHPSNAVLRSMQTGMVEREQPILFIATTAGDNEGSVCYTEERKVAVEILEGLTKEEKTLALVYTLDSEEEVNISDCWVKANPNLGATPRMDNLSDEYVDAKNRGGRAWTEFLTKNMNIWTNSPKVWIPSEAWIKCQSEQPDLSGRVCYGGLDLASVSDTCALCLFFPPDEFDEMGYFKWWFWLPEDTVRIRAGRVNYPLWVEQGWIQTTPGNVADYEYIRRTISGIMSDYALMMLNFDRWSKLGIVPQLIEDGVTVNEFGQGFGSMSTPSKEFERLILGGQVNVGQSPVAKWMNGNVVLDKNPADDIKPNKDKSHEKIDGIVAAIMALAGWMDVVRQPQTGSYLFEEDTELITV